MFNWLWHLINILVGVVVPIIIGPPATRGVPTATRGSLFVERTLGPGTPKWMVYNGKSY